LPETLEMFLKQLQLARGVDWMAIMRHLREYIDATPVEDIIRQINEITDIRLLKYLIAAKPIKPILEATLKRYDELLEEQLKG
jgi:hypothetical protein